jgi:hypothetical protein
VSVLRTLSNSNCIQGQSWGYNGNTIWVDRGCRADFLVSPVSTTITTATLICESDRGGRRVCRADTTFGVRLSRRLSKDSCIEGRSWGYNRNGVWVSRGCRAEFLLGPIAMTSAAPYYPPTPYYPPNYRSVVVCESHNNTRQRCSADTRFGVQLGHQMSDNICIMNDSWGWDSRGVWVSKGCRAEFILGNQ